VWADSHRPTEVWRHGDVRRLLRRWQRYASALLGCAAMRGCARLRGRQAGMRAALAQWFVAWSDRSRAERRRETQCVALAQRRRASLLRGLAAWYTLLLAARRSRELRRIASSNGDTRLGTLSPVCVQWGVAGRTRRRLVVALGAWRQLAVNWRETAGRREEAERHYENGAGGEAAQKSPSPNVLCMYHVYL